MSARTRSHFNNARRFFTTAFYSPRDDRAFHPVDVSRRATTERDNGLQRRNPARVSWLRRLLLMSYRVIAMAMRRRIALIAHDNCKGDLLAWARFNRDTLSNHELYATGTTGSLLSHELSLDITRFLSGPLGGDQQVGAGLVEGRVDFVILFWDPLEPHPARRGRQGLAMRRRRAQCAHRLQPRHRGFSSVIATDAQAVRTVGDRTRTARRCAVTARD